MKTWEHLRQQSNVTLGKIELVGAGNKRKVSLDVTVDGVAGAALGVMSQGELHSLALSLFLPRATLEESPFRFVVIDDPVQSMDPSRVDGLARALEETALTRQVIVFTHDERLPEAVRRLGIDSRMFMVTRRPGSVVEVRKSLYPRPAAFAKASAGQAQCRACAGAGAHHRSARPGDARVAPVLPGPPKPWRRRPGRHSKPH